MWAKYKQRTMGGQSGKTMNGTCMIEKMRNLEGHALVRSNYKGLERLKTFVFFFLITQAVGNPFRLFLKNKFSCSI